VVFRLLKSPPNAIIDEEAWVYGYDIETKQQSSHQKSPVMPHSKKIQHVHLLVNAVLLVSFDR
jgi:hypothetical protein